MLKEASLKFHEAKRVARKVLSLYTGRTDMIKEKRKSFRLNGNLYEKY